MKNAIILSFLLPTLHIGLLYSSDIEKYKISGSVHTADETTIDSLHIGLYYYWTTLSEELFNCYEYITTSNSHFDLEVIPDKYTIVVYAKGYQTYRTKLLCLDGNKNIKLDISLAREAIPEKIKDIKIIGDFCNWDRKDALEMKKHKKEWILSESDSLTINTSYVFLINDSIEINNLFCPKIKNNKYRALYNSIYTGEEVKLNPELYAHSNTSTSATVTGCEYYSEFNNLISDLKTCVPVSFPSVEEYQHYSEKQIKQKYITIQESYKELKAKYDPYFLPYINDKSCNYLDTYHPFNIKMNLSIFKNIDDYKKSPNEFFRAFIIENPELVEDYVKRNLALLKEIDPKSNLPDNTFINVINSLLRISYYSDELAKKHNITEAFFNEYIDNFLEESTNSQKDAELLYYIADFNSRWIPPRKEEMMKYLRKLTSEYPDSRCVLSGQVDHLLNLTILKKGDKAPDFHVATTNGKLFHLSEMQGQFVYIDFWGTWCHGCILEIPYIIKLYEEIPDTTIQIIGLAKDTEERLVNFLNTKNINYPCAVASETLLNLYGITKYPSNFLINPEGIIIAKDIKGEDLSEIVKKKIGLD